MQKEYNSYTNNDGKNKNNEDNVYDVYNEYNEYDEYDEYNQYEPYRERYAPWWNEFNFFKLCCSLQPVGPIFILVATTNYKYNLFY